MVHTLSLNSIYVDNFSTLSQSFCTHFAKLTLNVIMLQRTFKAGAYFFQKRSWKWKTPLKHKWIFVLSKIIIETKLTNELRCYVVIRLVTDVEQRTRGIAVEPLVGKYGCLWGRFWKVAWEMNESILRRPTIVQKIGLSVWKTSEFRKGRIRSWTNYFLKIWSSRSLTTVSELPLWMRFLYNLTLFRRCGGHLWLETIVYFGLRFKWFRKIMQQSHYRTKIRSENFIKISIWWIFYNYLDKAESTNIVWTRSS